VHLLGQAAARWPDRLRELGQSGPMISQIIHSRFGGGVTFDFAAYARPARGRGVRSLAQRLFRGNEHKVEVTDRARHRCREHHAGVLSPGARSANCAVQSDGVLQDDRVRRLTRAAVAIDSPSAAIIFGRLPALVLGLPRRLAQRGLPGLVDGGVDPE